MATVQLPAGLTISCSVAFIPASTLLLGMRFYTRHVQRARIGIDDWIMIPAFVFLLGMQITMIVEFSKRMIAYPDPNFAPGKADASTNLAFWPFELQQIPALGLVKLSVVLFYRRIFNTGATSWHHWSTVVMLSVVTAWSIAFFLSFLFICRGTPADYWISAKTEKAHCVATQKLHLGFAISDTILDCFIMIMAIPMIWNLHMSKARKFAVTGVFGLGLITVAASVTRMVVFVQATALRYDPYLDFEYLDTSAMYWSMLETGLGFVAANLVVVYGLLAHSKLVSYLRSLGSMLFSKFSRVESQEDNSFQSRRVHHQGLDSANTFAYGEYDGRDTEVPLDDFHIPVTKGLNSTVE